LIKLSYKTNIYFKDGTKGTYLLQALIWLSDKSFALDTVSVISLESNSTESPVFRPVYLD